MSISIRCPCGKPLIVTDAAAGKRARCPACGQLFAVEVPHSDTRNRSKCPIAADPGDVSQPARRTSFGFGPWACLAAAAVGIPVLLIWLLPFDRGDARGPGDGLRGLEESFRTLTTALVGVAFRGILGLVAVALVFIAIVLGSMGYRRDSPRAWSIAALVAAAGWVLAGVILIRTVLLWFANHA
jgi:hypothetical protein